MSTFFSEDENMEIDRKRIRVSSQRQVTIPRKFFEKLGIGTEVECILKEDGILLKPILEDNNGHSAAEILKDLIEQGLSGSKLLEKFQAMNAKVKPAEKSMLNDDKKIALEAKGSGDDEIKDIFGN